MSAERLPRPDERRVRITLEGMAEPAGHTADVLRVRQDNGSLTWIDVRGATVEDVRPVRAMSSRSRKWRRR